MAAITSAQTGLWSATSTWTGGVVPGTADTVTIAATHVVTVDGTYVTGGDTTTRFLITGTVKASRTVNSSLTIRAFIQINNVNGGFDYGTSTDPIPQGITAELVINASATVVANKYQFDITSNASKMQFCGAPKTRNAFLTATVSAGATSIQVTSASGWVVGDQLILEQPTNLVTTQTEIVTITSISGTTIGVSAITNARVSGLAVSNRTCNVIFRSQSLGTNVQIRQAPTTESTTTKTEFRNATVANIGFINMFNSSSPMTNMPVVDSCVFLAETYNSTILFQGNTLSGISSANNNLFYHTATVGSGASFASINLCTATLNNNVLYQYVANGNAGTLGLSGAFSITGDSNRFNVLSGAIQVGLGASNFTNTRIRVATASSGSAILANGAVNATFENLDINSNSTYYVQSAGAGSGDITFFNPTFDSIDKFAMFLQTPSSHRVNLYNIGNALNVNRRYNTPTRAIGQSAVVSRGLSAIALSLLNSQPTGSYTFTFEGVNGISQRIIGRLRHDTTYGTSTPPSISFSGAGVSGSFTSSSTVNLWEQFDITLTPTSTGTITATVTFAGAGGGTAYLDGIYHFPWITDNWIYGFQRLAQVNSVVDANVTLSESSVAALASCTTLDNVYDAATYSAVVAGPTASAYSVIAVANGTALAFGSNSVTINNGAASAFAFASGVATVKSAALTSGAKFTSMSAVSFTMTTPVTNTTLVGNVSQATPTALTSVTITGNLTFNTNSSVTITLTNCTITGTVSNSGTGAIQVNRSNTTIGTVGANVTSVLVTSLTFTGLTNGSQVYIANGSGSQIEYVPSSGTSYGINTTGGTGTFLYKVARFGFITATGTFTPATASFTFAINLIPDTNVIEPLEVVEAYTALTTAQEIYDYISYYNTTNPGIANSIAAVKSPGAIDFLSSNVTLNPSAASVMAGTTTLTLKTSGLVGENIYYSTGNFTLGAATLSTDTKIRMANLNSELVFIGVSNIDLYSTESDRNNRDNLRMSITTSPYRFLYGATVNSVLFQTILYSETTASVQYEYNISLNSGNNILALDTTTLLLSINNTLLEEKTLVEAIKRNTDLVPALL